MTSDEILQRWAAKRLTERGFKDVQWEDCTVTCRAEPHTQYSSWTFDNEDVSICLRRGDRDTEWIDLLDTDFGSVIRELVEFASTVVPLGTASGMGATS